LPAASSTLCSYIRINKTHSFVASRLSYTRIRLVISSIRTRSDTSLACPNDESARTHRVPKTASQSSSSFQNSQYDTWIRQPPTAVMVSGIVQRELESQYRRRIFSSAYNRFGLVIFSAGDFGTVCSDLQAGAPSLYKPGWKSRESRLVGFLPRSKPTTVRSLTLLWKEFDIKIDISVACCLQCLRSIHGYSNEAIHHREVERSRAASHFFPNGTLVVLEFDNHYQRRSDIHASLGKKTTNPARHCQNQHCAIRRCDQPQPILRSKSNPKRQRERSSQGRKGPLSTR
jgi:hypothetical protein